jgi:cytochrome P450
MTLNFDPGSSSFAANPYPAYAQLRKLDEPYYFPGADVLLLSRFADVEQAARNPQLVRSPESFLSPAEVAAKRRAANWHDMPNHQRFVQFSLLDSDGEVHDRLRRIVMKHMSRRFVEGQRDMIRTFVARQLEPLLAQQQIDFISDLAAHIPGHIIGSVLGVPAEDCQQLRIWSENVVQFFDINRTAEHKALAERATSEFYLYLRDLIAAREQQPKQDLISSLIAERDQGNLNDTELISTCMLILMAGHGSTIDVLGSGMLLLLKDSSAMAELRARPELMPSAVQEMFRMESPLPFFHRYAKTEVEVMGRRYPVGTRFGLLYGSANRDPEYFADADQFQIDRQPNRHIAFARGAHLCLGNHLSRIDMEEIFTMLLARTRTIELCAEPEYRKGLSTRGMDALQIKLVPN